MLKNLFAFLLILSLFSCEQQPYQMGERLYKTHCANCHMDGGEGLGALIPPLKGSDYLAANRERLACMIRYGLKDTIMVNGKVYLNKCLATTNSMTFKSQTWLILYCMLGQQSTTIDF